MKKALAILIALVLVFALAGAAFAVNTYSITIDNAEDGETYTAYKIFDVTYSGANATPGTDPGAPAADPTHLNTAYSYTIADSNPWFDFLTDGLTADANGVYTNTTYGLKFTPTSTDPNTYVVEPTATGGYDATKAAALAAAINAEIKAAEAAEAADPTDVNPYASAGTGTGASGSATIDVNPDVPGYYFVSTTTGSLCSLDTTEPTATIREKNAGSVATKQVLEDKNGVTYGDKNDAEYGETVTYKTTLVIGAHQKNVVLHDTLYNGLKLCPAADFTVTVGGTPLAAANYTITRTDDSNFTIAFDSDYTEGLASDTTVIVEYTAEVLTNAILDVPSTATVGNGNDNKTWVTYGANQESTPDWTRTYVWSFPIFKYTGTDTPLADANFSLYRYADQMNPMQFVQVSAGSASVATVYRLATAADIADNSVTKVTELVTPASGLITIQGVDSEKFVLKENAAPAGYNKLSEDITVEIVAIDSAANQGDTTTGAQAGTVTKTLQQDSTSVNQINVLNNSGAELPSTGSIGTTIFYVIGGLLVAGAVVVLIVRKRMKEQA